MEFSQLLLLCLPVAVLWVLAAADVVAPAKNSGCPNTSWCGDVEVPYPYALDKECAIHSGFHLNCSTVGGTSMLLYTDAEVTKISVKENKAWLKTPISRQCYNQSTKRMTYNDTWVNTTGTPFVGSADDNKVTVLGCSNGYKGNPYIVGGCTDIDECQDNVTYPCAGICKNMPGASMGLVVLVVAITCAYSILERRRLHGIKQKYFRQHGGLLLFQEMKSQQGVPFKMFSEEEVQEATDRFTEQRVIGQGGHGKVYKGVLKSNEEVAVKRCMTIDEQQKKEFGKEMLILSQINHRNIVKLLGCCLEVEVPMLVYEFVPNGTLFHLIHGNHRRHISLDTRVRVALESAEALAYLHSCASPPIVRGDVKSPNILLNDKSDVYSFGVVLLELLTRRRPFNLKGPEHEKSLSMVFLEAMKENKLEDIIDDGIKKDENLEFLDEIAELAKQCLEMCGADRPSMKEVADKLGSLRKIDLLVGMLCWDHVTNWAVA
ncbi:hypothetical protein HU200_061785 [Digitaria exilis]|uniref:Protein kinase domain-containing protein n=1 Tax=Digitaria exilis TaxID=1010633 RepID=A0A835A789_9POAL|nr:hypothetical protein HU200_061785 [Digitaria exilis]